MRVETVCNYYPMGSTTLKEPFHKFDEHATLGWVRGAAVANIVHVCFCHRSVGSGTKNANCKVFTRRGICFERGRRLGLRWQWQAEAWNRQHVQSTTLFACPLDQHGQLKSEVKRR